MNLRTSPSSRRSRFLIMIVGIGIGLSVGVAKWEIGTTTPRLQGSGPSTLLDSTDPALCTVDPRSYDDVITRARRMMNPAATPEMIPAPNETGTPADTATITAITDTVTQVSACINAGDLLRYFALLSDGQVSASFVGRQPEALNESLATPAPVPLAARVPVPVIRDVLIYPDGRVTAILEANGASQMALFVKSGDRYVIAAAYPPTGLTATPVP